MLGGVEEDIKVDEGNACLTNPIEAVEFVEQSGCDSLAAAIGTSHGAYKFKGQQSLHFEVIEAIQELPGFPLVMHGSSSVPKEEVDAHQQGGRQDRPAPPAASNEDEYLPAAKLGVTKVNIDTDGRLVWTRVHREFFRDNPGDVRLPPARQDLYGSLRRVHRAQKCQARFGRPVGIATRSAGAGGLMAVAIFAAR